VFAHDLGGDARLGPLEPWHATHLLAAVDADRDHMLATLPFAHTVRTVEDARTFLQRFADAHAADTMHLTGIWTGETLVGLVMFAVFDTRNRACEIGVWISRSHEGRGLVNAACTHVIAWAIRERGMRRVAWVTDVTNHRSREAARRLGFTREGVLRQAYVVQEGGPACDDEVWSILATEWPPADERPISS
jgi:RimJ/RimL family protein N-acetyltransferase